MGGTEAPLLETPGAWSGTVIVPICHWISIGTHKHSLCDALTWHQKCQQKQICYHQMCFCKLKMHQNPFSAPLGSLRLSPDSLVGWAPPHSSPLDASSTPSASQSRRRSATAAPCLLASLQYKFLHMPLISNQFINVWFTEIVSQLIYCMQVKLVLILLSLLEQKPRW